MFHSNTRCGVFGATPSSGLTAAATAAPPASSATQTPATAPFSRRSRRLPGDEPDGRCVPSSECPGSVAIVPSPLRQPDSRLRRDGRTPCAPTVLATPFTLRPTLSIPWSLPPGTRSLPLVRATVLLANLRFQHLAEGITRQLVHEGDVARRLVAGQPRAGVAAQIVAAGLLAVLEHDDGLDLFAPLHVRHADHGRLFDRRVLLQHRLD